MPVFNLTGLHDEDPVPGGDLDEARWAERRETERLAAVGERLEALMARGYEVKIGFFVNTRLDGGDGFHVMLRTAGGCSCTDHHAQATTLGEAVEVAWGRWGR